jgi:phosphotriesterase-related protein
VTSLNTARGAIDTADLGVTLMHEHVFIMTSEIFQNYPEGWGDESKRIDDAIARLNELKSRGVDTIVDLTVVGLGRYIPRIARIAGQTDLNIIVATGLFTYNDVPFYFHYRGPGTALGGHYMTDMFVRDIEQGIADTGVKAAILKCATDEPGVTPGVERVLRAVAQAHRHTGVPISTHTHAGTRRGLEQQRIFTEEGVDLTRVVIGHSGDTTDLDYLEGAHRQRLLHRHGPVRSRPVSAVRGSGEHRGRDVRARSRRQDGAVPRRHLLLGRIAGGDAARQTGITCISTTTSSRR